MTPQPTPDAVSILIDAADAITERGVERDQPTGERSMARAVRAFNAMCGTSLTEHQGWQFMVMLKMARSTGGALRLDDYTDAAAYCALAGETAARTQQTHDEIERRRTMHTDAIAEVRKLLDQRRASRGSDL